MRRLPVLVACLLLLCYLPIRGWGVTLTEPACREAAPFLVSYRREGQLEQDLACLYTLDWESATILAYRESPGNEPASGDYTLENLEDTTEAAGKLRAILLGGYPAKTLAELTRKANPWLLGRGREPICNLQSGEALLATQAALWKYTGKCQIQNCYSGWKDLQSSSWTHFRKQVKNQESLFQQETVYTQTNVAGLVNYLENLTPVDSQHNLISSLTLADGEYRAMQESDGGWTVKVRISLEDSVRKGDNVTIRAVCAEAIQEQEVWEEGDYTFSFPDLEEPTAVTVTLQGTQQGDGVYLFRNGTATLLGYAAGPVPVWGQAVLTPDRILRLTKTTPQEAGGEPLANIQFNVYLAATQNQLDRKEVRLSAVPTPEEVEACQTPESLVAILSTDEFGTASYNFTAGGDPEGVYLVVEQFSAATTGPVDPFYITVPGKNSDSLDIHLENRAETLPELTLKTETGEYCPAVGQTRFWKLTTCFPAGLANARDYGITLNAPQSLCWEEDTLAAELSTGDGTMLRLKEDVHYTQNTSAEELQFYLTPAGMAFCAAQGGTLTVSCLGTITQAALPGIPVVPTALLEYKNAAGIRFQKTTEGTPLTVGSIHLEKVTGNGRGIAGAVYRLARPAVPEDGTVSYIEIQGENIPVVYLRFWPSRDFSGESTDQVMTDSEGSAWLSGLGYGTYYLVETRGASGYRTAEALPVILDEPQENVSLSANALLPNTGSAGAMLLMCFGILTTIAAFWLLLWDRQENRKTM